MFPIEFRIDGLTTMMLSMVTFVSSLVAVFAAGYMAGDPGYRRFFALIGLFVFSMTGLVLSNNYVLTYVFWEGVGVCSYLLVGFWHTRPSGRRGRDEGVSRQPDRRLRFRDRDLLALDDRAGPRPELRQCLERGHPEQAAPSERSWGSGSCCSGRPPPRVHRSRFMCGSPMRWKAPRRCRP